MDQKIGVKYYLAAGLLLTIGAFVLLVLLPSSVSNKWASVIFQPAYSMMTGLPGGKENPLNLVPAVAVQTAAYAFALRIFWMIGAPVWEAIRTKFEKSNS